MNIKALTSEAIDLLQQLINTPSISREEEKAADVLCTFMEKNGLTYSRHLNNVWSIAPHFDEQKPTLLLNAHIDTVKPVAAWTRNPFKAKMEGNTLYGLGSNDDGASVVSLLQAFRVLNTRPQPYNLIFLASAEEEVSGKNGIECILPLLPQITLALVGEPTDMQPAVAEKGLMVLDVDIHGKAGHAARNEGVNALYEALDAIDWFRTYRFPETSELLGDVKMSVTIINAGTQHNVVPDKCTFTVDVRSNENYSNREIYETACAHIKGDVKARSFRLNSSRIDLTHPIVQRAIGHGLTPFGSPTLSDQALMPFPSIKMGPGHSSRSHTADEFIKVDEIEKAIALYVELLDGLSI